MLRYRSNLKSSDAAGYTIIELSIVIGLIAIIIPAILAFLYSAQNTIRRDITRSTSNDQVRLAAQALDREVRSGDVLYDPATEVYSPGDVASGMSVRVYTQSNFPTHGGKARCVQWRITSARELQRRDWDSNWQSSPNTLVRSWRTVATGMQNRATGTAAFARPSLSGLAVNLLANDDPTSTKGATVQVKETITGRNTVFFAAASHCGPPVPDPSLTATDGTQVPPY